VQVDDVVGAGDEARIARFGGDEAIETLAEVPDDERAVGRAAVGAVGRAFGRQVEQRAIQRAQRRDPLVRAVARGPVRPRRRRASVTRRGEQLLPAAVFSGFARLLQGPGLLPPRGV
jgi:hypothetical protein